MPAVIHSSFVTKKTLFRPSNIQRGYSRGNVRLMISLCLLRSQLDGNGDGEPGVLMTAQTITSESLCTTTTTHITKVRTTAHILPQSTYAVTSIKTFYRVCIQNQVAVVTAHFGMMGTSLQYLCFIPAPRRALIVHNEPIITDIKPLLLYVLLQTLKGGLSETRIEKRIVITGDCDIDHDEVSSQEFIPLPYFFCQQPG